MLIFLDEQYREINSRERNEEMPEKPGTESQGSQAATNTGSYMAFLFVLRCL